MTHWKETTLGNEAEVFVGHPFRSDTFSAEGVRLLRGDNISQGRIEWADAERFPDELASAFPAFRLCEGDLVLAMDRPWVGAGLKFARIREQDVPSLLVQRAARLRGSSGTETEFLHYVIAGPAYAKYIKGVTTGSLVPHISKAQIQDFPFLLPPVPEQRNIAAVLSALDDKIDLNYRINAELEALAKTIYDYWFVQFDFPDAKGRPYKTSGGKMVWNDALKREIPAEWKPCALESIISRSGTGLNPRDNFQLGFGDNYYVTIKNVYNGKIVLNEKCDRIDDKAMGIIDQRSQLQSGDVLFTSIEPVGITYLIREKPVNWNINESVFTIRPDRQKITSEYLLFVLSSAEMKAFTKNSSAGSIHKGIRHAVLKSFKLPYSSKALIARFSSIVQPMLQQIHVRDAENRELTHLRDWLLPLLMSGQVRVV